MNPINSIASYIPYVQVGENAANPIRIFGLRERQWQGVPYANSAQRSVKETIFTMPDISLLPDKFSKHWQNRLEAELRARKYSPKTMRSYIYYNSFLCRTLQKTPEEISQNDITQFLAREISQDSTAHVMTSGFPGFCQKKK